MLKEFGPKKNLEFVTELDHSEKIILLTSVLAIRRQETTPQLLYSLVRLVVPNTEELISQPLKGL